MESLLEPLSAILACTARVGITNNIIDSLASKHRAIVKASIGTWGWLA